MGAVVLEGVTMKRAIVFTSPTCGPCHQLAEALAGVDRIEYVDATANPDMVKRYHVRSVPTAIVLHGGREYATFIGYSSEIVRTIIQAVGGKNA